MLSNKLPPLSRVETANNNGTCAFIVLPNVTYATTKLMNPDSGRTLSESFCSPLPPPPVAPPPPPLTTSRYHTLCDTTTLTCCCHR